MIGNPLSDALLFIATALLHLYVLMLWVRFLMQAAGADFYNPITQSVVKITDPVLALPHRLLAAFGKHRFDYAALAIIWLLCALLVWINLKFPPFDAENMRSLVIHGSANFFLTLLRIYFFALLILALASWIAPASANPALRLLVQLTEPLLAPIRNLMPKTGMLDFSVLVAFLIIMALENHIVPGLVSVVEAAWPLQ